MLAPCDVGRRLTHPAPGWHEPCTWPGSQVFRVYLGGQLAVVWMCDHHIAACPRLVGEPELLPPGGRAAQEAPDGPSGGPAAGEAW